MASPTPAILEQLSLRMVDDDRLRAALERVSFVDLVLVVQQVLDGYHSDDLPNEEDGCAVCTSTTTRLLPVWLCHRCAGRARVTMPDESPR